MKSTMVRVLDELLWRLRRDGMRIPTSSAIDAVAAVRAVGIEDRDVMRAALAAALVKDAHGRRVLDRTFDAFFADTAAPRDLRARLGARGFSAAEIDALLEALEAMSAGDAGNLHAFLERGTELDRVLSLAGMERTMAALAGPLQRGFFVHRALERAGAPRARRALASLRAALRDALGARGDALADALADELDAAEDVVRARVASRAEPREFPRTGALGARSLASLDRAELDEVRRAVRSFSARLAGGARVRMRRARRGRIDPHRTLRRAMRTLGVPMSPAHVRRRRDKPRLVLLCDVSDSVREVAGLLLEFVYSAHELFQATRSFVFVSDVGEATAIFRRETPARAIAAAHGGAIVPVTGNSSYGRSLRSFIDRFGDAIDKRTTVVILGDGRTNYQDTGEDALRRIRARAKSLLWICPESRERWAEGDSAMARYAPLCTDVLEVMTARDLERAARRLILR